ncbi:MAG: TIGR03905 family TSCPD domain-containing protein [Oscillospiraceae bacterium]|nr:TIGR03905 family TSCPD domain-containing protein [Oscillospiraceae bacterium]
MTYEFTPSGVCSQKITFELDGDLVKNVKFTGGCNGNLKGIGALVEGMKKDEVIEKLSGIRCGFKRTSCPDQLARALSEAE